MTEIVLAVALLACIWVGVWALIGIAHEVASR